MQQRPNFALLSDEQIMAYIDSHPRSRAALDALLDDMVSLEESERLRSMPTETKTKVVPSTPPATEVPVTPTPKDIAKRIVKELPRGTNQYIKATPTSANHFRVNWFQIESGNALVKTNKIVGSKYLRVTIGDDGKLVVEDNTIRRQIRSTESLGYL